MSTHATILPDVSANLIALRELAAKARARRELAALPDADAERLKLHRQIAEDEAAERVSAAERRMLLGMDLESKARAGAGGKYLVRAYDLAALLPDLPLEDVAKLPGAGVLVLRSPPTQPVDALATFYAELEHSKEALPDTYATLVCASVVSPDLSTPGAGERLRAFFESPLGRGTAISVGDTVAEIGGVNRKRTKRGR